MAGSLTYGGFLLVALLPVLLILGAITWVDKRQHRVLPGPLRAWPAAMVTAAHIVVALLYTTPWDNYLVATGVWWYDPNRVAGLLLGWVPVEEYGFFVLQTATVALWLFFLAKRLPTPHLPIRYPMRIRWTASGAVMIMLVMAIILLVSGWRPGTYLALELVWALPPILLQVAIGADILWLHRHVIFVALLTATLYLGIFDAWAIQQGVWTIDPIQSSGIFIGLLPLEEAVFFLVTNMLVIFGCVLVLSPTSQERVPPTVISLLHRLTHLFRIRRYSGA